MKKLLILLLFLVMIPYAKASEIKNISIEESLQKLREGNTRFVEMRLIHPDQTIEKRMELIKGQHPFVIIITCSDSRVAPEIIFDQGLGDIFEIRNAGNVLDDHVIGSIEYAVAHLGTPVILVLGHEDCGAIKAAIAHNKESKHIKSLVKSIEPAVKQAEKQTGDMVENTVKNNVVNVVNELRESKPILKKYYGEGKVEIIGGYYHLDSGKVDYINN